MPKHGWKWRTERVRESDHRALCALLGGQVSGRLARWIYENLIPNPDPDGLAATCLIRIGEDYSYPKKQAYLWRELEKHKADPLGDWAIIGIVRDCIWTAEYVERFMRYYEDESSHPMTRGSAIFGINSSIGPLPWFEVGSPRHELSPELWARVRETCAKACIDENPYARAGAAWLAKGLGGFEAELAILAKDETVVPDHGATVSSFASDY